MPQEHHVLRCFSCGIFQVHIVKKARKWECKMCGSKQSVKRNYGRGTGKECRKQVMKLNEVQLLKDESRKLMGTEEASEESPEEALNGESRKENWGKERFQKSKWTKYLEEGFEGNDSESGDSDLTCLNKIVEKKKRTKKIKKNDVRREKICRDDCCDVNDIFVTKVNFETCKSNEKNKGKHVLGSESGKETKRKHTGEATKELLHTKYSKYGKYLDDDLAQINKSSNIFGSSDVDLDNILNF